jgi:hypothetical protein
MFPGADKTIAPPQIKKLVNNASYIDKDLHFPFEIRTTATPISAVIANCSLLHATKIKRNDNPFFNNDVSFSRYIDIAYIPSVIGTI